MRRRKRSQRSRESAEGKCLLQSPAAEVKASLGTEKNDDMNAGTRKGSTQYPIATKKQTKKKAVGPTLSAPFVFCLQQIRRRGCRGGPGGSGPPDEYSGGRSAWDGVSERTPQCPEVMARVPTRPAVLPTAGQEHCPSVAAKPARQRSIKTSPQTTKE